MGDSIPQIDIPRLIEFYRQGMFPFDKTWKILGFEDINLANEASIKGETINRLNYRPRLPTLIKIKKRDA